MMNDPLGSCSSIRRGLIEAGVCSLVFCLLVHAGRADAQPLGPVAKPAEPAAEPGLPPDPPAPRPATSDKRPAASTNPTAVLQKASDFFENGQHKQVIRLLRPIIEQDLLKQKVDQVEALRIYGISLYLAGLKGAARLIFHRLVTLSPSLKLDPRLVPPEVIQAFERARRARLAEILQNRRIKRRKYYSVLNLIPPAGQFQNGHHTKAWILLSLEIALLATNLATYIFLRTSGWRGNGSWSVQNIDGHVVEDRRTEAKALIGANYASFGLLISALTYGIIDGFVYMTRLRRRERKRIKFLQEQLQISALTGPSQAGVSLQLSF